MGLMVAYSVMVCQEWLNRHEMSGLGPSLHGGASGGSRVSGGTRGAVQQGSSVWSGVAASRVGVGLRLG